LAGLLPVGGKKFFHFFPWEKWVVKMAFAGKKISQE